MEMCRKALLGFFLIVFANFAIGQKRMTDSLSHRLSQHTKDDSVRVSILVQLANAEMYNHPVVAGQYAEQALIVSNKIKYGEGVAVSYRLLGNSFWAQANQLAALDNFLKGMKVADSVNSEQIQADLFGNLGIVYNDMGDFNSALKYY